MNKEISGIEDAHTSAKRRRDASSLPFTIGPFEEVVGVVESATDDLVTLLCTRKITLQLGKKKLVKWRKFLVKDTKIGVLKIDYGHFKVRLLQNRSLEKRRDPRSETQESEFTICEAVGKDTLEKSS